MLLDLGVCLLKQQMHVLGPIIAHRRSRKQKDTIRDNWICIVRVMVIKKTLLFFIVH